MLNQEVANILANPTLSALIVLSVVALGVGLERMAYTWRFRRRLRLGRQTIVEHLKEGKHTMAQAVNVSLPWHPATSLFEMLLGSDQPSTTELRRAQAQVVRSSQRRLWILGSIGAVAPFVGLLGTVLGVMDAFRAIGADGAGGFQVVSAGLSAALVTTAAGIFVGVEAVILFNYLKVCVSDYAFDVRESVEIIGESVAGGTGVRISA